MSAGTFGACPSGQACTPDGTMCRPPKTCADYAGKCGPQDDGTGKQITCLCTGTQECVSGTCCQPKTCNQIALEVGGNATLGCVNGPKRDYSDGCGNIVQCPICAIDIPL